MTISFIFARNCEKNNQTLRGKNNHETRGSRGLLSRRSTFSGAKVRYFSNGRIVMEAPVAKL